MWDSVHIHIKCKPLPSIPESSTKSSQQCIAGKKWNQNLHWGKCKFHQILKLLSIKSLDMNKILIFVVQKNGDFENYSSYTIPHHGQNMVLLLTSIYDYYQ